MNQKPKFLGKYRIGSIRAQWWNYSNNGAYFITICTQNRSPFFGEIVDEKMILSESGKIAQKCWDEIPVHFPFVKLGSFVVMPDHVHGIIFIENNLDDGNGRFVACNESSPNKNQIMSDKSPKKGSLSSIVRSYKSAVSRFSKEIDQSFKWQSKYHDIIIQDNQALENISKYIEDNVKNWKNKN